MQRRQIDIKKIVANTGQIQGLPANPRKIRQERLEALIKSIEDAPSMLELRELIVYPHGDRFVVIGGNMRLRALHALDYKSVTCKVLDADTPPEVLREIAIKDNVAFGDDDWQALGADWQAQELQDWGMEVDDRPIAKEQSESNEEAGNVGRFGDILFASDNAFDIPTLATECQPTELVLPIAPYGANSRARAKMQTAHFYIDDYRFSAIWKHPEQVLRCGASAYVEPNFSLHDQTPIAYGLSLIYKKRWCARAWQTTGALIWCDLYVAPKFQEYNLMGVPEGYNAFMTRGDDYIDGRLEADYDTARRVSGCDHPNIVYYGGGAKTRNFCEKKNVIFIEDFFTAKKKIIK